MTSSWYKESEALKIENQQPTLNRCPLLSYVTQPQAVRDVAIKCVFYCLPPLAQSCNHTSFSCVVHREQWTAEEKRGVHRTEIQRELGGWHLGIDSTVSADSHWFFSLDTLTITTTCM